MKAATEAAKELDAIQFDTPTTRCLDFHSLRRAYATALASTGLNVQQAMPLAGHKRSETHLRYGQLTQRGPLVQPIGAVPRLPPRGAPPSNEVEKQEPPEPGNDDGALASALAKLAVGSELSAGDPTGNRSRRRKRRNRREFGCRSDR